MTKKVYVKTFGCQMNEYDSDKMVDVLGAAEGLVKTDTPEDADVILFNTCSVREKAQEKVFSDLGRVRELKEANPNLLIGVGGCVASQEGASIVVARALCRSRVRPANAASPARHDRQAPRHRPRAGRHLVSGNRKVRSSAARARRRPERVRLDHGRLQQVLQLLRRAVHARRGSLAPARRRAHRNRRPGRPGRARSHAARPERERVSRRADARFARHRRFRHADRIRRGRAGHRAHSLYDVASEGIHAAPDRHLREGAEARLPPAFAGAARLRPHPDGDEARLHRARIQVGDPQAARDSPGFVAVDGHHRRLSGRNRGRFRRR